MGSTYAGSARSRPSTLHLLAGGKREPPPVRRPVEPVLERGLERDAQRLEVDEHHLPAQARKGDGDLAAVGGELEALAQAAVAGGEIQLGQEDRALEPAAAPELEQAARPAAALEADGDDREQPVRARVIADEVEGPLPRWEAAQEIVLLEQRSSVLEQRRREQRRGPGQDRAVRAKHRTATGHEGAGPCLEREDDGFL